jgi:predicted nucleic-acid-binding protein
VLRILVDEGTALNVTTRKLTQKVHAGEIVLVVPEVVAIECVWVLKSYYELDRETISDALTGFLSADGIECNKEIIEGLEIYKDSSLDIVDIYISILSNRDRISVLTWDKGFKKLNCEYYAPSDVV